MISGSKKTLVSFTVSRSTNLRKAKSTKENSSLQISSNYCVWIHLFFPISYGLLRREEKPFGMSWKQTQVLLLHKDRSNHSTMPLRAPLPSGRIRQLVGERGEKQLLVPHWYCPWLVAAHQRWFPEQPGAGRAGVPPRPGPGLSGWPERPRVGPGLFCGLRSSASSKSTKHKTQNTKHKTTATQEFWKWKKGLWTGDLLG